MKRILISTLIKLKKVILMKFFFLLLFGFLISCTNRDKTSNLNVYKYYPTYTKNLKDTVQTLEFQYISWGCACTNWTYSKDYKYLDSGRISDIAIFIEPSDSIFKLT